MTPLTEASLPQVGTHVTICIQSLLVRVKVIALKRAYGHTRVQVQPPGGTPQWIDASKIVTAKEPQE